MAIVILGTWHLLTESLRLSLDAVPAGISTLKIKQAALKFSGVKDIHHIHIWAMSTTKNAMTAHLILESNLTKEEVAKLKSKIKHELEHLTIHHSTLETENENCNDEHED